MDVKSTVFEALAHHRAGRLADAERLYRLIADGKPGIGNDAKYYPDAVHNVGLIAAATGRMEEAFSLLARSVELRPRDAGFRKNFAATLINSNRPGDMARALTEAKRGLELAPADLTLLQMVAHAALAIGDRIEAIPALQRLAVSQPNDAMIRFNLGVCLQLTYRNQEAIAAYREAVRLRPGFIEAMSNLADTLELHGQRREASALMRELESKGNLPDALKPLTAYLLVSEDGAVEKGEALAAEVERARANDVDTPGPTGQEHNWMKWIAGMKAELGLVDDAVALYQRFCEIYPADVSGCGCLLAASQYLYPDDPPAQLERHRRFDREIASRLPRMSPAVMRPLEGRRLRVGYVSGDFRVHSVGVFIEPLLVNHDSSRVEVHCYSNSTTVDAITERIKARADKWHDVSNMFDQDLAVLIRTSGIDVLIDLSGHTSDTRLSVFALRAAPVQLTYLGYSSTTGLSAIDGLITDAVADPPGESDTHFCERLLRLPHSFAVVRPPRATPDVSPPPFRETGRVTLGCVALKKKINDAVLDAWCAGMRGAPESQLLLIALGNHEPIVQKRMLARFAERGITADRIAFLGRQGFLRYIELHGAIDLMLDTFPFSGHTTTVQNLWMGVPVVTYAGVSHRSRMTASVLTAIGLPDLIAHTEAGYGPLIARWANDPEGLMALRAGMRARMKASPLMDEPRFARDFEDLLIRAYETKLATGHV